VSEKKILSSSKKDIFLAVGPPLILVVGLISIAYRYIDPAPARQFVISTGEADGDYQSYAEQYKEILKDEGINLILRPSKGTWENMSRLKDPNSDVEAGFVEDGLGSPKDAPDLSSLGSLYYEPVWLFYRGNLPLTRFSQLKGKKVAIGIKGGGAHTLALQLLKVSGIDKKNAQLQEIGDLEAVDALTKNEVDAALFLATPDDQLIKKMMQLDGIHLMSVDQAEAVTRQIPFLHHLILPHGVIDLSKNIPDHDIDLVSPTATLLVRDSLHPALVYLLLKAAAQVHSDPGIFEKKNEFPVDKDYQFPLSDDAKNFYKSGAPFWQRYLPFWLATLVDRFIIIIIPLAALIIPIVKLVPRFLQWRVKNRIYQRYGELKFLEAQIQPDSGHQKYEEFLVQLDAIDDRVHRMKVPLDFSEFFYGLREHIHFVRERLHRLLESSKIVDRKC